MKLKDPGTTISKTVVTQNFKGKEYLMLRATYDKEVGSDVWQFYFDPTTYAMEVYQFFKADPGGAGKNTHSGFHKWVPDSRAKTAEAHGSPTVAVRF